MRSASTPRPRRRARTSRPIAAGTLRSRPSAHASASCARRAKTWRRSAGTRRLARSCVSAAPSRATDAPPSNLQSHLRRRHPLPRRPSRRRRRQTRRRPCRRRRHGLRATATLPRTLQRRRSRRTAPRRSRRPRHPRARRIRLLHIPLRHRLCRGKSTRSPLLRRSTRRSRHSTRRRTKTTSPTSSAVASAPPTLSSTSSRRASQSPRTSRRRVSPQPTRRWRSLTVSQRQRTQPTCCRARWAWRCRTCALPCSPLRCALSPRRRLLRRRRPFPPSHLPRLRPSPTTSKA